MSRKAIIFISSVLCLLPAIFSALVFSELPEQVAIHWNSSGAADNYVHKSIAAFGIPVLFAVINFISKIRLLYEPNQDAQSQVLRQLSIWMIPALSIVLVPVTLSIAMGANIPIVMLSTLLLGMIFIVFGNYLPKCKQNYSMGIKLPWTLANADNWNKTHRLAGYLWICGGIVLISISLLTREAVVRVSATLVIAAVLVLVPTFYSYSQFIKEGRQDK